MSAAELKTILAMLTAKPAPAGLTMAHQRARFEKMMRLMGAPAGATPIVANAGGVAAAWLAAPGVRRDRAVLYLHGGGYCIGSINTHRGLCYDLSAAAGVRVLALDYRLAPEHPFPAALDDAVAAFRWLANELGGAEGVALAGDSAGGGLAVATAASLRDQGVGRPGAIAALSPWVDLEGLGRSMTTKAALDPMVNRRAILDGAEHYLAGRDPRTPLAAPLHADLHGLPPLLIQVGTAETLLDDATRLASHAASCEVDVTLRVWPDMIHVWHLFAPILSEGRDGIAEAGRFLRSHLG